MDYCYVSLHSTQLYNLFPSPITPLTDPLHPLLQQLVFHVIGSPLLSLLSSPLVRSFFLLSLSHIYSYDFDPCVFLNWLVSPNDFHFIYFSSCGIIYFSLRLNQSPLSACTIFSLCIHFSQDMQSDSISQVFLNSSTKTIDGQVPLWENLEAFGYIPRRIWIFSF